MTHTARYEEDEGEYSINAEACAYPPPKELAFLDYETVKQHLRDLYSSEPTAKELTDRAMQRLKVNKALANGHKIESNFWPAER